MTTRIRPATHDDIPRIVEMATVFYADSPYADLAPMTREAAAGLAILTMQTGTMLVAESDGALVGMLCLHIDPFVFNASVVFANEIVFWVAPEARGGMTAIRLIRSGEDAARAAGASRIRMATLASSPEQADQLYLRTGYALTERFYTKELA